MELYFLSSAGLWVSTCHMECCGFSFQHVEVLYTTCFKMYSAFVCTCTGTPLIVSRIFFCVFFELLEESVFLAFGPSLCSMVFSALVESNASLQITATSVLTLLAQQTGERTAQCSQKFSFTLNLMDMSCLPGLLLDSDIELAVDHLTRLLLTEEDSRVRFVNVERLFKCGFMMLQQCVLWRENAWLI